MCWRGLQNFFFQIPYPEETRCRNDFCIFAFLLFSTHVTGTFYNKDLTSASTCTVSHSVQANIINNSLLVLSAVFQVLI
jgi:hypothetical protein